MRNGIDNVRIRRCAPMGMLMRRPGRWERSTPVDKNRLEEGYTVIKPNMKDEKRIFFMMQDFGIIVPTVFGSGQPGFRPLPLRLLVRKLDYFNATTDNSGVEMRSTSDPFRKSAKPLAVEIRRRT